MIWKRRGRTGLVPVVSKRDMASLPRKFGARVRDLRRARAMSRSDLAERLGVEPVTVARLEQGRRFNSAHIEALANVLEVEPKDLFDFKESEEAVEMAAVVSIMRRAFASDPLAGQRAVRLLRLFFGED